MWVTLSEDGRTAYVSNQGGDSVDVVDVTTKKITRTIALEPYKDAPIGSNPTGLASIPSS